MAYNHKLLKTLNFSGKPSGAALPAEQDNNDIMMDARYLRQSSALINDSLKKGFDVLQLANGDIVTTGTKTIVTHYAWDDDRAKLTKTKTTSEPKKLGRRESDEETLEEEAAE